LAFDTNSLHIILFDEKVNLPDRLPPFTDLFHPLAEKLLEAQGYDPIFALSFNRNIIF
jgi:hypothetical protein